jgi:hypothetical protein
MGPEAAPGLESEYNPKLSAGRLPGTSSSLLIKRSGVRIPLRHQPNPTLNTILDGERLSVVHGRPWLSAPKDALARYQLSDQRFHDLLAPYFPHPCRRNGPQAPVSAGQPAGHASGGIGVITQLDRGDHRLLIVRR